MKRKAENRTDRDLPYYCYSRGMVQPLALCLALVALLMLAIACGGGGSGSSNKALSGSALSLPDRISLSEIENGGTGSSGWSGAGFDEEGTDYSEEPKHTWMDDTEALTMINEILQVVDDSAYEQFVNAGPYKALVTPVGDGEESKGGANATSSATEELMEITIDVTRVSNDSPMILKVWVMEDDGPGGASMLIRGYFEVTEGVSEQYPYGAMKAYFKGNAVDEDGDELPGDPLFTMAMSVNANNGNVVVQFLDAGEEDDGPFTYEWDRRARIIANTDLTEGKAFVYDGETDWESHLFEEETLFFVFNEDYFKFQEEGAPDPVVLDKSTYEHEVYMYKLFDEETGDRVEVNSGFPIRLEDGEYAYIGYYGLWAPYGSIYEDGDEVTRVDTDEDYFLVNVRGKLTKHTREQILLGDLTDVEISVWDNDEDIVVIWDGVDSFYKIGVWDHETGTIDYLETPEVYTFANEWDGGWCNALHAWLPLGDLTPDNADVVNYHAEETVNPSTAQDLFLYYWGFALDAPITQTVIDNAPADEAAYWSGPPTEKDFFFDSEDLVLREEDAFGAEVILGPELNLEGTMYQDGFWMGPLTEDGSYTESSWWDIYNSDEYYYWQTGPREWNQFTTVVDGEGVFADFDKPLRLAYTHSTDNDINGDSDNDGVQYSLDYDGFDLRIPWIFDEDEDEWVPAFNLKDGTVMTAADDPLAEYVVKGVEEELIMTEVTDPIILAQLEIDLPIDMSVPPPTLNYNPGKTAQVGAVPWNAILKVIKGEVLGTD